MKKKLLYLIMSLSTTKTKSFLDFCPFLPSIIRNEGKDSTDVIHKKLLPDDHSVSEVKKK